MGYFSSKLIYSLCEKVFSKGVRCFRRVGNGNREVKVLY